MRMQPFKLGDKKWKKATITERLDERSYLLETPDGATYRRNRQHLKKSSEDKVTKAIPDTTPVREDTEPHHTAPQAEPLQDTATAEPANDPAKSIERPRRTRQKPAYLKDYV